MSEKRTSVLQPRVVRGVEGARWQVVKGAGRSIPGDRL